MSSVPAGAVPPIDDRTAKARIRDAAIESFATHGVAATTARSVAAAAGVSPGLVIHHFGSMEGLRSACDEYVAAAIRQGKQEAIGAGPTLDLLAALRSADMGTLIGYLAAVLTEDSPAVAALVDNLVSDAEVYLEQFVATGWATPTDNPRGRAAVLMLWSLGALVLHSHAKRLLGVDLTDPNVGEAMASYALPAYEILGTGILTEQAASQIQAAFGEMAGQDVRTTPEATRGKEEIP